MNHYHKNSDNTISVSTQAASCLQKPSNVDHHQTYCEAFRQVITGAQVKALLKEKSPVFKIKDFEITGTHFYCPEFSCHAPLEFDTSLDCFFLKEKGRRGRDCPHFATQGGRR